MSVYIKGMDMPVDCLACRVACDKESYMVVGRPPKCPLAEAPDGDLIGRAETIEAVELMETFLGERKKNAVIRGIQALPSAEIPTESTNTPTNTPTDLISRADAIEAVDERWGDIKRTNKRVAKGHEAVYLDMRATISALPSADAVEVARCKNCKYKYMDGEVTHYYWCRLHDRPVDDTDYCAWGEESEVEE